MTRVVRTVLGDIDPTSVGLTLFHEHLWSDMTRWIDDSDLRITSAAMAASELTDARKLGLGCLVDATTTDVGGNRSALAYASRRSGVHVVGAAGLYREISYPTDLPLVGDDQLTLQFIGEVAVPDPLTGTRAGVYGEVGSSSGGITRSERRVFRCVARAHLATGAPIITHTPEGQDAHLQLDILEATGVSPDRVVIGHLDCAQGDNLPLAIARRGAWVGFDRIGLDRYTTDASRMRAVARLIDAGFLERILLSSDVARRSRLRRFGGPGYLGGLLDFLRGLSDLGFGAEAIRELSIDNPVRFLAFHPLGPAA